jgi:hypothetical protein
MFSSLRKSAEIMADIFNLCFLSTETMPICVSLHSAIAYSARLTAYAQIQETSNILMTPSQAIIHASASLCQDVIEDRPDIVSLIALFPAICAGILPRGAGQGTKLPNSALELKNSLT